MQHEEQSVFLSYTAGDRDRVEPIADSLRAAGLDVWIDVRRLKAGQNWDFEIRLALDRAAVIVVFVSNKSVTKRGYVQREIRLALEKAEEKLVEDIYVIPVLLDDDVIVPSQIKDLQFIRSTEHDFERKLLDAIKHQLERVGIAIEGMQGEDDLSWQYYNHREFRDGVPGIDADLRLLRVSSDKFPLLYQVGDVIRGDMFQSLMDLRAQTLVPDLEAFNFGQDRFWRIHTLAARPQTPKIRGRVLSIVYSMYSFFGGAAHSNLGLITYCFLVDPLCRINRLEEIFDNPNEAFMLLQNLVRSKLLVQRIEDGEDYSLDKEWVHRGTEGWSDFKAFSFDESGLEIHFEPYHVGPYAAGPQLTRVGYDVIAPLVSRVFKSALQIEFIAALPSEASSS